MIWTSAGETITVGAGMTPKVSPPVGATEKVGPAPPLLKTEIARPKPVGQLTEKPSPDVEKPVTADAVVGLI